MKQQIISLFLALLMIFPFSLSACSQTPPAADDGEESDAGVDILSENESKGDENKINPAPETLDVNGDGAVKILSLGNSFSGNAYKYLHPILTAYGVENLTLGNLHTNSCDLSMVAGYTQGEGNYQIYYKYNTDGVSTQQNNYPLLTAVTEEDWDIITLQQASGYSGKADTYSPALETVLAFLDEHRTVKNGLLAWHMTWAYQQDATHSKFPFYENDQMKMYQAIVRTTEEKILASGKFDLVIPSGTAIQNARTSSLGDTMTGDGYHLTDAACLMAGYAWYTALTGEKIIRLKYVPESFNLSETYHSVIKKAANAIVDSPFAVSEIDE